jgi:hypothetical protein
MLPDFLALKALFGFTFVDVLHQLGGTKFAVFFSLGV